MDEANMPLVRAHLGLLLATMLLSGMQLNLIMFRKIENQQIGDCEKESQPLGNDDDPKVLQQTVERFVSLKASAQTLTPELDVAIEKNWMNEYPTNFSTSDATSTPSVVKHILPYQAALETSNNSLKSKLKNSSFTAISPTAKKQVFEKIQRRFTIKSPTNKDKQKSPSSQGELEAASYLEPEIDAKYVTRLSTIPDVSKSYLNVLKQTNEDNSAISVCLTDSDDIDGNLLKMEKDAINLYNSVLLPSILHSANPIDSTVNSTVSGKNEAEYNNLESSPHMQNSEQDSEGALEHLMENDLQIKADHTAYSVQKSVSQPILNTNVGNSTITVEYWNKNKDTLLNDERDKYGKSVDQLYNAFNVDAGFSFPMKKSVSNFHTDIYDGDDEVMSFVDRAVKSHESGLIEEGLKQNTSSNVQSLYSHEPHSPTKSISSIVTAMRTPVKFNTGTFSPQHTRDDSQISLYLSNNNSRQLCSAQSSPTRLKKRLSQKLSRSNLRNDEDSQSSMHFHSKSLTLSNFQHNHSKSNSVNNIDLSYVHSLQQKHSPQKSMCTINARRRSSIYQSVSDLKAPIVNSPKTDIPIEDLHAVSDLESFDIKEEEDDCGSSLSFNLGNEFAGKGTKLGEYDREKLSILFNRQQIYNK
ncbi:unnamed protein product [Kluyveromyces dobzhanskii CBS 2104]|uniref:WGS project CCBQ000000000 data, contig 00272 n=1 Tax=Kluyveromyces dobzhanskii CBS 2104 TaxID=1427455 RepID=A0A0A8LB06_9SACH|nr:unnamed protein product [Kluyveromyces dobzhanskii CBS 2104]